MGIVVGGETMDDDCCEIEEHATDLVGMGLVRLASHQCYQVSGNSHVNEGTVKEKPGIGFCTKLVLNGLDALGIGGAGHAKLGTHDVLVVNISLKL